MIRKLWKIEILIFALLIFGAMSLSFAQDREVDFNVLCQELQKESRSADEMTLVFWIPEEYWWVNFERFPDMAAAETEEVIKLLRPYTVIMVVDGKVGPFGGVTYTPKASIQNSIQIVDSEGTHYRPLGDKKIDADTKNLLSMTKPFFTNMLGPMGENIHFFLFLSLNKKGQRIADPKSEGTFSVKLGKKELGKKELV